MAQDRYIKIVRLPLHQGQVPKRMLGYKSSYCEVDVYTYDLWTHRESALTACKARQPKLGHTRSACRLAYVVSKENQPLWIIL